MKQRIPDVLLHEIKNRRTFIIYAIIGMSGVILDYLLFLVLFNVAGINEIIATIISTSAGIVNNFIWNALVNFKVRDRLLRRFFLFYAVGGVGIALTAGILYIFSGRLGFDVNLVKLLSIVIVVIVQYNLNKYVSFKSITES
ncbi:MAG: GtrA family protein [Candidatus Dojkabacteria bacterium]